MTPLETQPARASGEFRIAGDLPVVRLGYGAMQIPGRGVWGEPRDHDLPFFESSTPCLALENSSFSG